MTEMNYMRTGDYLIPDMQLKVTEPKELGKYGRMRREFLKNHKPMIYNDMILEETLFPHLWEIQETATVRKEQMMAELLKQNPAPDKKTMQMEWIKHMNMLDAQVEEEILAELINN